MDKKENAMNLARWLMMLLLVLSLGLWSCGKSTTHPGDNDQTGDQDQTGDEDNPGDLDTDGVDTDPVDMTDQDQDKVDVDGDQDVTDGDQTDVPTDEDLVDGQDQDQPTDEDAVDGQDQDEPGDQDQTETDQEQVGGLNLIFLRFVAAGGSATSTSFQLHGARIEAIPAGAAASEHFRLNQATVQAR